jgi:hypothetical protein
MDAYIPYDPECNCKPCREFELQRHMNYVLDHLPITGKIEARYVDEFRRLVSIDRELTFTERLMELDAFSASTASHQRELVHRYAVAAHEAQMEECVALGSELSELESIIEETEPLVVPLELARTGSRRA